MSWELQCAAEAVSLVYWPAYCYAHVYACLLWEAYLLWDVCCDKQYVCFLTLPFFCLFLQTPLRPALAAQALTSPQPRLGESGRAPDRCLPQHLLPA
jgi:hypothetical protein